VTRLVITPGEPAGIGPDLVVTLAARDWPFELVAIADPGLLADRARALGVSLALEPYRAEVPAARSSGGRLRVEALPLSARAVPGTLDRGNARYVLDTLQRAAEGCRTGEFAAMVTAPVHKGVINDAGFPFQGHTEFLAELTGTPQPVMLLVAGSLRVALLTTHLALRDVPAAITRERLHAVLPVVRESLVEWFGIPAPRLAVLGLNPHAGESGHLGTEERDVIEPALAALRERGLDLHGPLPADSAFTPEQLARCDVVVAMYHDQGLPVLKHVGFGGAVNVTLGLPIIRTSVDHGTALELAGTGRADAGSLAAALELAARLAHTRRAA
jgi:4-hydroxythreonine-4-phosphate dehydrogenase